MRIQIAALALLLVTAVVSGCENRDQKLAGLGGASSGGGSASGGATGGNASGGATAGAGGSAGTAGGAGASGSAGAAGASGASGASGNAGASGASGASGADGGNGACNYLTQIGAQVTALPGGAGPTTPIGGTITDGFYKLTSVKLYGGALGTTFWRSLRFVGNELKTVERDGPATTNYTSAGTYVATGAELARSIVCPSSGSEKMSFSATTTTFTAQVDQGGGKIREFVYLWDSP